MLSEAASLLNGTSSATTTENHHAEQENEKGDNHYQSQPDSPKTSSGAVRITGRTFKAKNNSVNRYFVA